MPTAMICTGVLLLMLSGMVIKLRHMRHQRSPVRQKLYLRMLIGRILKRLGAKGLQGKRLPLSTLQEEMHCLRRHVDVLCHLPVGSGCSPRMLCLARVLTEDGVPSADAMVAELTAGPVRFTSAEIAALPLALAFALAEQLQGMLEEERDAEAISDSLYQYASWFSELRQLNWPERGEEADALHTWLLEEPSGTYPRMTAEARLALRVDLERFARHTRLTAEDVASHVLDLCRAAGPQALEAYAGYWMQTAEGVSLLHRSLGVRAGWLYARLAPRSELRRYGLRCIMGGIAGFAFLQAGHPVFMLPFFLICAGAVARWLLAAYTQRPLPAIRADTTEARSRTLVAVPAMLKEPGDALRQVGRLQRISRIFGHEDADFILLGDLPAHITAIGAQDSLIAQSALEALANAGDVRLMYLQRSRIWNDTAHIYQNRGGYCGAVQTLCELVVHGECTDPLFCASFDPALLERRYAYILTLPEDTLPTPDLLSSMQSTLMHPLNARYPAQGGWQGYSLLTPGNYDAADGCWLLRPDAFLEATAGFLSENSDDHLLCCELAGYAAVRDANAERITELNRWDARKRRTQVDLRLLAWQLPWVRTSSGIEQNPLRYFARFRLRDRFGEDVLPIAQTGLLLWALLTGSWALLALALLTAETTFHTNRTWTDNLLSMPTRAAVSATGLLSSWLSKRNFLPAWDVLELWAQWIAAALLTGLAIALPGMRTVSMLLAAIFAASPFLRRR